MLITMSNVFNEYGNIELINLQINSISYELTNPKNYISVEGVDSPLTDVNSSIHNFLQDYINEYTQSSLELRANVIFIQSYVYYESEDMENESQDIAKELSRIIETFLVV